MHPQYSSGSSSSVCTRSRPRATPQTAPGRFSSCLRTTSSPASRSRHVRHAVHHHARRRRSSTSEAYERCATNSSTEPESCSIQPARPHSRSPGTSQRDSSSKPSSTGWVTPRRISDALGLDHELGSWFQPAPRRDWPPTRGATATEQGSDRVFSARPPGRVAVRGGLCNREHLRSARCVTCPSFRRTCTCEERSPSGDGAAASMVASGDRPA